MHRRLAYPVLGAFAKVVKSAYFLCHVFPLEKFFFLILLPNNSDYTIDAACSRRLHKVSSVVAMKLEPEVESSSIEGERFLVPLSRIKTNTTSFISILLSVIQQ